MADKKPLGVFTSTETTPPTPGDEFSDLDRGRIVAQGVGLKEGELDALNNLAAQHNVKRNSLMRWAIRYFLVKVLSGEIDLNDFIKSVPASNQLKMP